MAADIRRGFDRLTVESDRLVPVTLLRMTASRRLAFMRMAISEGTRVAVLLREISEKALDEHLKRLG